MHPFPYPRLTFPTIQENSSAISVLPSFIEVCGRKIDQTQSVLDCSWASVCRIYDYDHTYFVHRSYVGCLHVEQTHIIIWECLQRRDPKTLFFSFLKIKFRVPLFGDIPTCLGGEVEDCGIQPSQCVYASDLLQVAVSLQWVKKSNVRLFRSGAWHTVLNHKACQPDSDPAESHDGCLQQARNFAEGMRRKPNCQAFWIWWCIAIQLLKYNFRLNQFVDRDHLPTIPWNNFRLNQFLDPLHTIPFHIWIWYIGAPCMGGPRHNRQFYSFAPVAQRLTLPWTIWWCVPGWGIALFCWILIINQNEQLTKYIWWSPVSLSQTPAQYLACRSIKAPAAARSSTSAPAGKAKAKGAPKKKRAAKC